MAQETIHCNNCGGNTEIHKIESRTEIIQEELVRAYRWFVHCDECNHSESYDYDPLDQGE